jgi:hypothetical protein
MGNTFGPNGFSIGSSRQVSSSKSPKSWCMTLTSQMCSPTCVTPTFCPAKTRLRFTFRVLKHAAAADHGDRLIVKRIVEVVEATVDAR